MLVVNLFGAPGAGKSTGAAYIFSVLKMRGINCELVTEFAKDKVWEEATEAFNNQAYIFGNQAYRLSRCEGKVDVIITDSPLPLSIMYNADKSVYTENFDKAVMDVFNHYNNLNFFIKRTKDYQQVGRIHSESQSDAIAWLIPEFLTSRGIDFIKVTGDVNGYQTVVDKVLAQLGLTA